MLLRSGADTRLPESPAQEDAEEAICSIIFARARASDGAQHSEHAAMDV